MRQAFFFLPPRITSVHESPRCLPHLSTDTPSPLESFINPRKASFACAIWLPPQNHFYWLMIGPAFFFPVPSVSLFVWLSTIQPEKTCRHHPLWKACRMLEVPFDVRPLVPQFFPHPMSKLYRPPTVRNPHPGNLFFPP